MIRLILRAATAPSLLALVLGACSVASVETPDPAAIPSGSLVPLGGEEATGREVTLSLDFLSFRRKG